MISLIYNATYNSVGEISLNHLMQVTKVWERFSLNDKNNRGRNFLPIITKTRERFSLDHIGHKKFKFKKIN